jgi:hypothetical protein
MNGGEGIVLPGMNMDDAWGNTYSRVECEVHIGEGWPYLQLRKGGRKRGPSCDERFRLFLLSGVIEAG